MTAKAPPPVASFFWRRLDGRGHDSCRLLELPNRWRLSGAAVFAEAGLNCHLHYIVDAEADFRATRADVAGYVGNREIHLKIRSPGFGKWQIVGRRSGAISGCPDVDLGFTPATNLLPIRRLGLRVGEAADAPAAYLSFPKMTLIKLPQRYERVARDRYAYAAPTVGYAGTLRTSRIGAVVHYPDLFELVSPR